MRVLTVLLEITVYSWILFAAILLLKKIIRKRSSPTLQYLVWFLFMARLCIPITFDSGIHLFVIPESYIPIEQGMDSVESRPMSSHNFGSISMKAVPKSEQAQDNQVAKEYSLEPSRQSTNLSDNSRVTPTVKINWYQMVMGLWLSGIVVVSLFFIRTSIEMNKKIKKTSIIPSEKLRAIVDNSRKELHIKRPIAIYVIEDITTPALTVSWNPKLLFPAHMIETMEDEKVLFAVRHELTHFKGRDHLVSLLLRLLEALYWFNPIVWIASKKILMDMELACDSRVVKNMEKAEKAHYASTILGMFSEDKRPQFVLGMAMGGTRDIAEKRIRGIYTKGRTRPRVRLLVTILSATLIFSCFTTACQPTPEKPTVIGKGDGKLDDRIDESVMSVEDGKSIGEVMGIPNQWSETFISQNGKVSFNINGEIDIPRVEKIPVAEVSTTPFIQEQVDKIVEVLLGGNQLYEPQGLSREQIEASIIKTKAQIAEAKNDPDAESKESKIMKLEAGLEASEKQYGETPEFIDKIPVPPKLSSMENNEGYEGSYDGLNVMVDTEVGNMFFTVKNYKNYSLARLNERTTDGQSFKEYHVYNVQEPIERPKGVNISKDEAQKKAKDIAQTLDDGLELVYTGVAGRIGDEEDDEHVWQMVFTRTVEGFVTPYETHEQGGDISVELTAQPVPYEKMVISINDKGIAEFQWQTPMRVDRIANKNVALMAFGDIQGRAKDMLQNSFNQLSENYEDEVEHTNVYVNRITLGFARINVKDRFGGYKLVPVWDFYGHWQNELKDTNDIPEEKLDLQEADTYSYHSLLTINAIDGSVIDRNRGY